MTSGALKARLFLPALYASLTLITPAFALAQVGAAAEKRPVATVEYVSDEALVASLPGFKSEFADVNGTRLHYVAGGKGEPVVLLPGWPETWWAYHKIMPTLARNYRVISVDIRSMGSSGKPLEGYDKKNMAKDIHELLARIGHRSAHIVGHDIGAQVAWSFAANYPQETTTLTMLDVPHPDEGLLKWPLLPAHGTFNQKIDEDHPYAWWFAFHQVRDLPEQMLQGRAQIEHEWFFRYLLKDESAINARDRAVYAAAYNQEGGIRAGNAWYQAFTQDIIDEKTYGLLKMPVLGLAGPGYAWLNSILTTRAETPKSTSSQPAAIFSRRKLRRKPSPTFSHFFGRTGNADQSVPTPTASKLVPTVGGAIEDHSYALMKQATAEICARST